MTNPSFTQLTFRGRYDDGNETGATWKAAAGADWTQNTNENFRVRFRIDETASRAWTNKVWNLYYSLNASAYAAINGTTAVRFSLSSNFTDGADCTEQLTGGTGTFVTDNNGMKEATGGATNSGSAGNLFELEYCLTLNGAQITNADTINLRVYDGTSALAAYTDTPIITASKIAPSVSDGVTVGESASVTVSSLAVSASDGVTVGESPTVELPGDILTINVSDNVTLGESQGRELVSNVGVSDSITVADVLHYYADEVILGEAVTVVVVSEAVTLEVNVSDGVTLGESPAVTVSGLQPSVADGVTVGETASVVVSGLAIPVTDGVTVGDSATVNVVDAGAFEINVTDGVTIGESTVVVLSGLVVSATDGVTLGESATISVEAEGVLSISVTDGVTVGESVATSNPAGYINVTDSVAVSDTAALSLPEIGALSISVTDGITVGENVSFAVPFLALSVSDNVTVADATGLVTGGLVIGVADSVTVTDVASVAVVALITKWVSLTLHPRSLELTLEERGQLTLHPRSLGLTLEDK